MKTQNKLKTLLPAGLLVVTTLGAHAATTYINENFEGYTGSHTFYSNLAGSEVAGTATGSGLTGISAGSGWSGGGGQNPLEIVGTDVGNGTVSLDLNNNGIYWTFVAGADTSATLAYDADSVGGGQNSFWTLYDGTGVGGAINQSGTQAAGGSANVALTLVDGNTYTLALGSDAITTYDGAHIDNVSLTAVPEPSTALLGGLGLLAMLARRRK